MSKGRHTWLKPAPRCPALEFRPIQSHVGVSQELVWINLALGKSNPDARGDDDFVSIQIITTSKPIQQEFGQSFGLIGRPDRCLQNYKLVSTKSCNDACIPGGICQPLGDCLQKHVASSMAQGVIYLFELVNIDEVDRAHFVGPAFA